MYLFRNHLRLSDQLIFISYSRQDGVEFANKLAKDIRDRGGNTWIDKENIPDGSDWNMEIENAMTDSVYVLYVVTEAAKKSPEVKNEIQYAKEENKKLIPLQIDKKCKRPLNIRIIQYVDFTKDYTEGLNRLCKTLHLNGETGKQILNAKEPLPKINTAFKDSGLIKNTRNKSAEKVASKHTGVATVSKKISGVDSTAVKKKFNLQSAVFYSAYADPFW